MNGVVARCAECNYLEYLHNTSKLIIILLLREYILTPKLIIVSVRSLIICDYLKTKNVNLGVNNQLVWYKQQNLHNGKIKNWSWLFLSKQPKPFFNKTLSCVLYPSLIYYSSSILSLPPPLNGDVSPPSPQLSSHDDDAIYQNILKICKKKKEKFSYVEWGNNNHWRKT